MRIKWTVEQNNVNRKKKKKEKTKPQKNHKNQPTPKVRNLAGCS